ncbi:hypothetical protein JD844_008435 [Phrynosoma platyrhinos]|uniref:Uncharacterized protein n=1 Tax=Phrynosoma platyrhinos TaxID=52577 RepID=A0ABQ7TE30_PHRPL|nr:hypothetical protein JD844_008435 [Phrynosoma platyrhinos]
MLGPISLIFLFRSVIAQPIFVFKKEQPYKKPTEDPVCKAENVSTVSRKRPRSSSFSFQPSHSQLYGVKKNNIFLTSMLLQKKIGVKATEEGIPSTNVQWDVLKPAILQLPQASMHSLAENISTENVQDTDTEVSEDIDAWKDVPEKQSVSFHISGLQVIGNQLSQGRTFSNSTHSDFVFGENIVERVLRPEKSPELLLEDEPHNSENETTFTIDFHTSSPWTNFVKDTTLAESAAAYISNKPRQRYLLDKVELKTGEEAEHNVLQFLLLTVMRNQGSMRLVLNTKLWTQMVIKRANRKSLCITATDLEDCSVKASSKDAASLYAAIHHRLVALRNSAKQECDANQMEPESDIHQLNCESDEEENEKITEMNKNRSEL